MADHNNEGLSTAEAEELHAKYGYNEVKTAQVPEWKKILLRYLDWVSVVIVSFRYASEASDGANPMRFVLVSSAWQEKRHLCFFYWIVRVI